ncbi:MAG: ABC transporter ATP-binding protein [Anaerolineales bacterium]|nr:ABC transporter ATP-binding protein [Anaerolineales bacterium]
MNSDEKTLVQVRNLSVTYHTRLGPVSAVNDISFDINRSEILGLVGESGCGKSTLGKALMRMIMPPGEISGGSILFNGKDVMQFDQKRLRDFRGRQISMIFQDPMTSLNPVQRVDEHVIEAIQVHEEKPDKEDVISRVKALIERLGIQERRLRDYPHQLSGGMRQRVMIGLGLVLNADLIIADEATTSLDVIVEAMLVDQLREIREEFGVALLMITHNIALVAEIADRIAVMYAGKIVELGDIKEIFDNPLHPYTRGLLRSVPSIRLDDREELFKMSGEPPNLTHPPSGCRFHPRCPEAMPICSRIGPGMDEVSPGRWVHCWLYQDHPQKDRSTIKVNA